jgi:hypothetical protein
MNIQTKNALHAVSQRITEAVEEQVMDLSSELNDVSRTVDEISEKLDRLLAAVQQIARERHEDVLECVDAVNGRPCQCACHE